MNWMDNLKVAYKLIILNIVALIGMAFRKNREIFLVSGFRKRTWRFSLRLLRIR